MVSATVLIAAVLVGSAVLFTDILQFGDSSEGGDEAWRENVSKDDLEVATLAGGCFWCTEAVFMDRKGIHRAVSGYAGGKEETATYEQVSTGETDHREAVRLEYYPSLITYREILDIFWKSIDPTDGGGQFTDRGPQYTTAIYYHNEEQEEAARETKEAIGEEFDEPIQTEILEFTTFFPAKDRHQNYSEKSSVRYKLYKEGSGRTSTLDSLWGNHSFE